MVDLEAIKRRFAAIHRTVGGGPAAYQAFEDAVAASVDDVPALVAELEVARVAIGLVYGSITSWHGSFVRVDMSRKNYDRYLDIAQDLLGKNRQSR